MRKIDMHVHLVGNEPSGNGCWLRVTAGKYPLYALMLKTLGLPVSCLKTADFDDLYREKLLEYIRGSEIDAVCLLAQEAVYDTQGKVIPNCGNAYVPNDLVLQLAREHPEFLPAVSIHPARPDALDELDRCLENGAVMMKALPNCQNINCSDPAFKPFWTKMAEAGLPFLAHTGGENTLQVINRDYENPEILRLPLECGVTTIAAHCATSSSLMDPNYFPKLTEMFGEHKNLFADTSALNIPLRSHGLRRSLENEVVNVRLVHGSDYPVPTSPLWAWLRGLITTDEMSAIKSLANPIAIDHATKMAMGFSEEHFTRINSLLRNPEKPV